MIGKVLLACLLCVALSTCAAGSKRDGCRDKAPGSGPGSRGARSLLGLIRRTAAIASSLRKLHAVRERRWTSSYPLWKSLSKIKERHVDFSAPPRLPVPDAAEVSREFDETRALADKDRQGDLQLGWQDKPFDLPGLPPQQGETGPALEPSDDWGTLGFQGLPENHEEDWGDFVEPCSDDIVGDPCTQNSDCPGCGVFHCSTGTNTCMAGGEPDPGFGEFF